jgi:hypothetical protein
MPIYILRRILAKLPILVGISIISFIVIRLLTPSLIPFLNPSQLLDIFMDHWIQLLGR